MPSRPHTAAQPLSELETEVINLFVRIVNVIGLPRSVAEIYGLFFASFEPLCMDDVLARLPLSQGAVSQGLRQLRALGAIKPHLVSGDRRTFYEVEENLRKVIAGFVKEQVMGQLDDTPQRLERVSELFETVTGPHREAAQERAARLARWHRRTQDLIPVMLEWVGKP